FCPACSHEAAESHYFSSFNGKRYVLKYPVSAQIFYFQNCLSCFCLFTVENIIQLTANHLFNEPLFCIVRGFPAADKLSVPQNCNVVSNFKNFLHSMTDIDHADTFCPEIPHGFK